AEGALEHVLPVGTRTLRLGEGKVEAQRERLALGQSAMESGDERIVHVAAGAVGEDHADSRARRPPFGHAEHARDRGEIVLRLFERDADVFEACARLDQDPSGAAAFIPRSPSDWCGPASARGVRSGRNPAENQWKKFSSRASPEARDGSWPGACSTPGT